MIVIKSEREAEEGRMKYQCQPSKSPRNDRKSP